MAKTANAPTEDALSEAIWQNAASGDEWAITELYEQFMPSLVAFAQRQNAEDPEGSANLAFYDGVKALPKLRSHSTPVFRAYIYRAVRNRIAGQRRRQSLNTVPLSASADSDIPGQPGTSPEDLVVSNSRFDSLLKELTPAQRAVIHHRYLSGRTVAETARLLDRSPASVRGLQERSLARLRALGVLAVALVVGVGLYLLSQEDTPIVTDTPLSETPVVSTPESDDDSGADSSRDDGGELRVEVDTGEGAAESTEQDTDELSAESTVDEDTAAGVGTESDTATTSVPEPIRSSLRPLSTPDMCLGFNQSIGAIELQECRSSLNQQWELRPSGVDGHFELVVASTDGCMHVENYLYRDGARIVGSDCGLDQDNALWSHEANGTLVAKHSGKCITVDGGSIHEGAPVSHTGCGPAAHQIFTFGV